MTVEYLGGLEDLFDLLAMYPYMAHEESGLTVPLRVHRHHVCYVVENEDVEILRVLHTRSDWRSQFG